MPPTSSISICQVMERTSAPQQSTTVRDESFYFDDDPMAIFLVENQLFKVHRHFLIQGSEIFRDMFSQARPCEEADAVVEGLSDDKPIVLSDVTAKEFRTLLRYFYAMKLPIPNRTVLADILHFEQDEKLALLNIAHRFVFDQIFEYVCGELKPETISVADRVRLGDKYGLTRWLSSAYKDILERNPNEKLSQEEADALGLERTVKILEAKNSTWYEVYRSLEQAVPNPADHSFQCPHCATQFSCKCCRQNYNDAGNRTNAMRVAVARAVEMRVIELQLDGCTS